MSRPRSRNRILERFRPPPTPQRQPQAAFHYDANADLYTGMDPLTELDGRGLPPGFPDSFPVPQEATLVLAQRCRDGTG